MKKAGKSNKVIMDIPSRYLQMLIRAGLVANGIQNDGVPFPQSVETIYLW